MYKYILSLDPSGNFYEGKGTTGWCFLNCKTGKVEAVGEIKASICPSQCDYWNAHILLILEFLLKHPNNMAVSVEDFIIYSKTAASLINSKVETPQLLGVLKYWCYKNNVRLFIRPAHAVKKRWTNEILHRKGYLQKGKNKSWYIKGFELIPSDHILDAVRHAVHFKHFENKEE